MKKQVLFWVVSGAVVIGFVVLALVLRQKEAPRPQAPSAKQEAGRPAAADAKPPVSGTSGSAPSAVTGALPAADAPIPAVPPAPKPVLPLKEALSQKPVFAKLDFRTIPVPENEREAALRVYEKLVDAVNRKDVARIIEQAAQMRVYGLDDVAQAAYVAAADACPDSGELVKLADAQAKEESPAAGVLYARALYDAVQKGDGAAVQSLTDRMADVPPARDAWIDGMRYLLQEAEKKKDLARMTALTRGLYEQGDAEGAKRGFAACYAQAPGPKERLETVKEFDSFRYDLYAEDEAAAFFDQAVAAGDDETAVRFLEFLKTRGSERTEPLTIAYLNAAAKRDVPPDMLARASMPLVMYKAADTNVALMNAWQPAVEKAFAQKRLDDLDKIADFFSMIPPEQSAGTVTSLYSRMFAMKPPLPLQRKIYILERAARYGDRGVPLIAQEAPAVVKAAIQADDAAALETVSQTLVETKNPALARLGLEGYEVVRKKLAAGNNNDGLIELGRYLAVSDDPAVRKFAAACIGDGLTRSGAQGGVEIPLPVLVATVADAARLNDPPLTQALRAAVVGRLESLRTSPLLLKQYEDASRAAGSPDADIRKAANGLLGQVAVRAKKLADPEETLTVAAGLARSPDAGVRAAGVNLMKLLWEKQGKDRSLPPDLVIRLTAAMIGSGDPALKGMAEAAAAASPAVPAQAVAPASEEEQKSDLMKEAQERAKQEIEEEAKKK